MLNFNTPINDTKEYSEIKISEVEPILKINLRGKNRNFITKIGKELSIITPVDLQMDWIISKKKYDFIGKRSLYRSDTVREDRKQLVGLLTEDPKEVLEEGAPIVAETNKKPVEMLGHVTSSYFSPNLNKSIALAVVKNGKKLKGQKIFVPMKNKTINVTITDTVFLDKENKRLNA